MGTISKSFSYFEFEQSSTAKAYRINNTITSADVRDNIKVFVTYLLQPLRDGIGRPLNISSGYRCPALNKAVGGVPTSQHATGEAADVWCTTLTPYQLACKVMEMGLQFDQMILYPGFLHLSYKAEGGQRMQILYNKSYKGRRLKL